MNPQQGQPQGRPQGQHDFQQTQAQAQQPAQHPTSQTSAKLVGRGIVKTFGHVKALAGVSIDIPAGQQVAIMGPSGSGKSTLLHCMAGILKPDSGEIRLGDDLFSRLSDASRSRLRATRYGFVFQDGQLVPELNARENVALPLMLQGVKRGRACAQADVWLERLGIPELKKRRPGDMSGGQAQRVAIARALVHGPAVVFADEPTGALDQATGHEVMQILTTTARMSGASLVVVTHDPAVAAWCNRIVEIRDGLMHTDRLVQQIKAEGGAGSTPDPRNSAVTSGQALRSASSAGTTTTKTALGNGNTTLRLEAKETPGQTLGMLAGLLRLAPRPALGGQQA